MRLIDLNTELTALEILAPQAMTASVNGNAINLQGYVGELKAILDSAAGTGTSPTLNVKIQDSADGSTFADLVDPITGAVYAFSQVTNAASLQSIRVDTRVARQYIRAVATVGGTTPSFTCACLAVAQPKQG